MGMRWETTARGNLRVQTPAKLNLYLEVKERRADGFHEIDSLFQAVSLYDLLEFQATEDGTIVLEEEGIADGETNLVYRAAAAARALLPRGSRAGVRISLEKRIPQGAGLGGGSSDAAATLVALARLWNLRVTRAELAAVGGELGSDVPFFLYGGTARCRGRGEEVVSYGEVFDSAPPFHYVLAYPGIHSPTKAMYEALDKSRGPEFTLTAPSALDSITAADCYSRLRRGDLFFNRLEKVGCTVYPKAYPEWGGISSEMKKEGRFQTVLMTGSGSTFYGLCRSVEDATTLAEEVQQRNLGRKGKVFSVQSLPSCRFAWLD